MLKRLLKKADHDVINRDAAIVYAGGKFYIGGTHSLCLKQIKDDNPEIETVLTSYQYRPDIEQFKEISEYVGVVILAHLAKKENSTFIDFGIINGEYLMFDDIPDKYIKEFENEFKMEVKDEMKHDIDVIENPDLNPYKDEKDELSKNVKKEIADSTDIEAAEKYLNSKGYNQTGDTWVSTDETNVVFINDASAEICAVGEKDIKCQLEDIPKKLESLEFNTLNKFKEYCENIDCNFVDFDFFLVFYNNNGIEITVKLEQDEYTITEPSDLELNCDFNKDSIDECMQFIMNWLPDEPEEVETQEKDTNNNYNIDDIDFNSIDIDGIWDELDF